MNIPGWLRTDGNFADMYNNPHILLGMWFFISRECNFGYDCFLEKS